jgi:CBS domain containing-hemolysin-like protein
MLVKQSQKSGQLAGENARMIEGVFEFTEKTARDVMTPRTDIVALPEDLRVEAAAERIAASGRSRYPVYRVSLDDIVGIVHVKQVLASLRSDPLERLGALAREPLFVPGTSEVEDVLAQMKHRKEHMAIVLDEYGGTAGIVTMEDLLEEIVGQIYDEYDRAEPAAKPGDVATLAGRMAIDDANERFGLEIADEEHQTLGGFVFGRLGRLPKTGDRVPVSGGHLEVVEMKGRRVAKLKLVGGDGAGGRAQGAG